MNNTQDSKQPTPSALAPATGYAPWVPPFCYNRDGQWIEDARGNRLMDVRGWGFLTGRGNGLAIDEDAAAKIQDAMGERVTALINADVRAHNGEVRRGGPDGSTRNPQRNPPLPALNGSAILQQCAEYHRRESKRHKDEREMREQCNMGPAHSAKHEKLHTRFAEACESAARAAMDVVIECPNCGHQNKPNNPHCHQCHERLSYE